MSQLDGYYNRTNPANHYERHLFVVGHGFQSAEANELQDHAINRARSIGDAILKDGNIVSGCACVVNPDTGATTLASGKVYLSGMVRDIAAKNLIVPVDQSLAIGIRLIESIVTEMDDPDLRDPAVGTRNYYEPGAARLRVEALWGWSGDGGAGEFYPIYSVDNGILQSKEPPPNIDAVVQSIAGYDRDSSGGMYVVNGLQTQRLPDDATGKQIYSISAGRARVNGFGVTKSASTRFPFDAAPDLKTVRSEPHQSQTVGAQTFTLDRYPVVSVDSVTIQAQKTATLTHGAYSGVKDPLPDSAVLMIVAVNQGGTWNGTSFVGGTTYIQGTDYKLTGGQVDWSLLGAEPAPGSTYQAAYQYMKEVEPDAWDSTSVTVTGAVVGSLVQVDYKFALVRVDRLAMNSVGGFVMIKGVAAEWNPQAPTIPNDMLSLATIRQTWDENTSVSADGVRTVAMSDLALMNSRIDFALGLIAQQRLESDIHLREAGTKKGIFTDPFIDDTQRDAGIEQTGAIFNGELTLPVSINDVSQMSADVTARTSLASTLSEILTQTARTGTMKVNPYLAFDPIPAAVTLTPAVDNWTQVNTSWASAITERITVGSGNASSTSTSTGVQLLSSASRPAENLRPIEVRFSASGFGPNETLLRLEFDGVQVTPTAI